MSKPITDKQIAEIAHAAVEDFEGNLYELESAIGMLYTGKYFGWKPLLLIHDKKTIKKYEQILKIDTREIFPEVGEMAERSRAWRAVQKVSNFWKAVKGEIPGIRTPNVN